LRVLGLIVVRALDILGALWVLRIGFECFSSRTIAEVLVISLALVLVSIMLKLALILKEQS